MSELLDLAFARMCADWISTVDSMYIDSGTLLRPALPTPPVDPRISEYAIRAHISMMGIDGVRRFYGVLVQHREDLGDFVLALHGTRSAADYAANAAFLSRPLHEVPFAGRVQGGWHRLFASAIVMDSENVLPHDTHSEFVRDVNALIRHHAGDAEPRLTITGHSLGAAVLTLFVVHNSSTPETIKPSRVCTFASPMVGDADFVARYEECEIDTWRVVVDRDTVPKLPGTTLGYRHVGAEHLLVLADARKSMRGVHALRTYRDLLG